MATETTYPHIDESLWQAACLKRLPLIRVAQAAEPGIRLFSHFLAIQCFVLRNRVNLNAASREVDFPLSDD